MKHRASQQHNYSQEIILENNLMGDEIWMMIP